MGDVTAIGVDDKRRERREQIVARLVDLEQFERVDTDVFPHPRYELIGLNKVYDGVEEVEQWLRERRTIFPDQRNELISLHHSEDAVIAEFWYTGTHLGRIGDIEPSGKAFRCRMATFFLFEGDILLSARVYFDVGTIARQLA